MDIKKLWPVLVTGLCFTPVKSYLYIIM